MTRQEIKEIKLTEKWPVKFSDFYNYYFIIIAPLGLLFIGVMATLSSFRNDINDLKLTALIILTVGALLTLFTSKRLFQNQSFECYEIKGITEEKIERALKKTNLNNFKFYKQGYFIATTKVSWFSWGEEITIIIDNERLLINSRPTSPQPITILKDRKNIKMIVEELS